MHSILLPINSISNIILCLRSILYRPLDIISLLNLILRFKKGELNVYALLSLMCGFSRIEKKGAN